MAPVTPEWARFALAPGSGRFRRIRDRLKDRPSRAASARVRIDEASTAGCGGGRIVAIAGLLTGSEERPEFLAQLLLLDLAHRVARQAFGNDHAPWLLETREVAKL